MFIIVFSPMIKASEQSLLGKRSRSSEEFSGTSQPPKKRQKITTPCKWQHLGCINTFRSHRAKTFHKKICIKNPQNLNACPHCNRENFASTITLGRHIERCKKKLADDYHNHPAPSLLQCKWPGCEVTFMTVLAKKLHEWRLCDKNPNSLHKNFDENFPVNTNLHQEK